MRRESKGNQAPTVNENHDVAKVFFDTFSNRLAIVESRLKSLSVEVEAVKIAGDQGQLSDLVLLERQQKAEKLLNESLNWIKQIADTVLSGAFYRRKQDVPAEEAVSEPAKP